MSLHFSRGPSISLLSLISRLSLRPFLSLIMILIFSLLPMTAAAAEPLELDVEASLRLAEAHSWDLLDRRDELEVARYRRKQARGRFLPNIGTQLRYSRLSDVDPGVIEFPAAAPSPGGDTVPTPTSTQGQTRQVQLGDRISEQYSLRLNVEQPIFTGGLLSAGYRAAGHGLDVAEARIVQTREELRMRVEEAYFRVLQLDDAESAAAQSMRLLERLASDVEILLAAGRTTELERDEVTARLARVRSEHREVAAQLHSARVTLLTMLGLPAETEVRLIERLEADETLILPRLDVLLAHVGTANPELQVLRGLAAAADAQAAAAAADLLPRLLVRFSLARENPNQRYFPVRDEFQTSWEASAVLNWTLWDWGVNWYGWRAARIEASIPERAISRTTEAAALQVHRSYESLLSIQERLESARLAQRTSEQALKLAAEMFRLGALRSSELLEYEADRASAQAALTRTLAERRIAWAALRRVLGADPSSYLHKEIPG
jgi:outer membrane protein TolC